MSSEPFKRGHPTHNFYREPATLIKFHQNSEHRRRLVRKRRKKTDNPTKLLAQEDHTVTDNKSKATPHPKTASLKNANDGSSFDGAAVPDPIPDTGNPPTSIKPAQRSSMPSKSLSLGNAVSLTYSATSTFVPLPPLGSISSVEIRTSLQLTSSPTNSVLVSALATPSVYSGNPMSQQHHISTVIITLLAVGSAFAILGIFIVLRAYSRPRRRTHPTPSLPILDDTFKEHDFFDDSPIFAGKERLSNRPTSNPALWPWNPYPQERDFIVKPPRAAGYSEKLHPISVPTPAFSGQARGRSFENLSRTNKRDDPDFDPPDSQSSLSKDTRHPVNDSGWPLQQVQSATDRATSRFSVLSMSLYPGSPLNTRSNIGVAVGGDGPFTADGYQVVKRSRSRPSLPRNQSNFRIKHDQQLQRQDTKRSQAFIYDGAHISSPSPPPRSYTDPIFPITSPSPASAVNGRSRIKSTYFSSYYPHISAMPGSSDAALTDAQAGRSRNSSLPIQRSNSQKDRETHALESALGLASPNFPPPSPQPTIYPDDSLSVANDSMKTLKRSERKTTAKDTASLAGHDQNMPMMSPSIDSGAALGNLMLMDFGATTKSLASLGDHGCDDGRALPFPNSLSKRSLQGDDKPPRVPSPPPLPSLRQMGLEHSNPEAYADYRSPTYSIFGLYQSDRKSTVDADR